MANTSPVPNPPPTSNSLKQSPQLGEPQGASLAIVLEQRREALRDVMRDQNLDAVLIFSTREHAGPSHWILGTPCKSDCHYSFITAKTSGVLEMPWRIPGLRPRLVTDELLIGVAGEHLMNSSIKQLTTDHGIKRVGIIGDAPFTHLEGLPADIVDLNSKFAQAMKEQPSGGATVGMTPASSIAPLSDFPLNQRDTEILGQRLQKLQAELVATGVGAALLFGSDKTGQYARWLTGVPTASPTEVIVVKPNSVTAFALEGGTNTSELPPSTIERRTFGDRASMQAALASAVKEIPSLGVVKEFPYGDLLPLSEGKTLVNMNRTIESLMAIKTPQELEILRHSARELATLMEETLASINPGMSGTDLEAQLDDRIHLCGSTRSFPIGVAADAELRGTDATTLAEPLPTQTINEAVCIDMGIQYAGLMTDATRMGFVGNPPIRAEYERLREVVEGVVAQLKPGHTVREFLQSVQDKLTNNGFDASTLAVEELGHGIGFDLHEEPFLVIEDHLDMKFVPGMVVCVEPEVTTPHGKVRVEEMAEITPDGAVIMTRERNYRDS